MSEPFGYFITWTTYGTWLPGDERGWVIDGTPGIQPPDEKIRKDAIRNLKHPPVVLSSEQRQIVDRTIREVCEFRQWRIHALNVRTNHVHLVLSADKHPDDVMNQLKAWCSRRLNELAPSHGSKHKWWTTHGSTKWLFEQDYFHNAVNYVINLQ